VPGPKVTREEMNEIMPYDTEMFTSEFVHDIVAAVPDHELPKELTDGLLFPWWVWLANIMTLGVIFDSGIRAIHMVRPECEQRARVTGNEMDRMIIVHSESGFYMISTKEAIIKDVTSTEFFALINTQPLRG